MAAGIERMLHDQLDVQCLFDCLLMELQQQWRRTGTWCRSRGSALNNDDRTKASKMCIFDTIELLKRIDVEEKA
jgi:hypothetical protein